jgi:hypothetical protein
MLSKLQREMPVATPGENPSFPAFRLGDLFGVTGFTPTPFGTASEFL